MSHQFRAVLEILAKHEVQFIVVGGLAGVLHGAPITTQDVDIVYSLALENQQRLLGALQELDAEFRADPRRIKPNLSHLATRGQKLFSTRLGDLDCLATIEDETTYEDLLPHVDFMTLDGLELRVISLPRLIEVKEKLTRPKDQLAVLQLRATLDERNKRE